MFVDREEVMEIMRRREQEVKTPEPSRGVENSAGSDVKGYMFVNLLSVAFVVVGILCLISGCAFAGHKNSGNLVYIFGGIIFAMFNFGWAVVMHVCSIYLKSHKS